MPSGGLDATPVAAPSNVPSNDRRIMLTSCGSSASRTRQSSSTSQMQSTSSSIELNDLTHDASVEVDDSQLTPEDPSNSVPPESLDEALTTPPNGQAAGPLTSLVLISTKACYQCCQSVLGLITLATVLVSLLFYGFRSYKLAVWTAHNDEIQSCTGLIQTRPEQPANAKCEKLISEGPQDPPYSLAKRTLHSAMIYYSPSMFSDSEAANIESESREEINTYALLALALILAAAMLADLIQVIRRRGFGIEQAFRSPARSQAPGTWPEDNGFLLQTNVEEVILPPVVNDKPIREYRIPRLRRRHREGGTHNTERKNTYDYERPSSASSLCLHLGKPDLDVATVEKEPLILQAARTKRDYVYTMNPDILQQTQTSQHGWSRITNLVRSRRSRRRDTDQDKDDGSTKSGIFGKFRSRRSKRPRGVLEAREQIETACSQCPCRTYLLYRTSI